MKEIHRIVRKTNSDLSVELFYTHKDNSKYNIVFNFTNKDYVRKQLLTRVNEVESEIDVISKRSESLNPRSRGRRTIDDNMQNRMKEHFNKSKLSRYRREIDSIKTDLSNLDKSSGLSCLIKLFNNGEWTDYIRFNVNEDSLINIFQNDEVEKNKLFSKKVSKLIHKKLGLNNHFYF
ncbi:MAG: hypothetical protein CL760_10405 [Chloroflexi bacterium]|nr:hypothetical protein [Chloroflexota bacterium]|tara:strand:+ start:16231 stop:16761 length:531 start_codon:yes stop_codon:yes gene_type:complete